MTHVALDLLKCYSRIALTNVALNIEDRKEAFGSLVAHLVAHVAGEKQEPCIIEFLAPADWWQHFKQRWFPGWLVRIFPVRMTKHERRLDVKTIYPYLRTALPPQVVGPAVTVLVQDKPMAMFLTEPAGCPTVDEYREQVISRRWFGEGVWRERCPGCDRGWIFRNGEWH